MHKPVNLPLHENKLFDSSIFVISELVESRNYMLLNSVKPNLNPINSAFELSQTLNNLFVGHRNLLKSLWRITGAKLISRNILSNL